MKSAFLLASLLVVTSVMGQGIVTGTGYAAATGANTVQATGGGNTVQATGGNTVQASTGGGNTVQATSGNTVAATGSGNTVAATGQNTIAATGQNTGQNTVAATGVNTVGATGQNTVAATGQNTVAATGQNTGVATAQATAVATAQATGTVTTNTVTIPPNQMATFTFNGPLTGFTGQIVVTSGAPVDVLGFLDQNFAAFQSGQNSQRAFEGLGVTTYTIPTMNIAANSILYIAIGNSLSTANTAGQLSTIQYSFQIQSTPQLANRPAAITTTGAGVGSNTGTLTIPLGTASVFTLPGPVNGATATFNVANGVPIDVVLLLNQAYTNYVSGQTISASYQVFNTLNTAISPINVAAGNTLYMLVGNNLVSNSGGSNNNNNNGGSNTITVNGRDVEQNQNQAPVVSYTISGLQAGQIIVPTTITKQSTSSASTALVGVATLACGLAIALL